MRRICTHCREPYEPTAEELALLRGARRAGRQRRASCAGEGCNFCAQTGYLERIGVYELLPDHRRHPRAGPSARAAHEEMRKLARAEGMRTLQEEAVRLVEAGVTTLAEVMRSIYVMGA